MSLSSEMSAVVHSLASTGSVRRLALEAIRIETARSLKEARANRHRTAVAQRTLRSEALLSTRLATAMLLGAANELVEGYRRHRVVQSAELKRGLAEGVKRLRTRTRKWLATESATRKKLTAHNRRERLTYRIALRNEVAAMEKRHRAFLAALTKDRGMASGAWHSRSKMAAISAPAPVPPRSDHVSAPTVKREVESKAAAKHEAVKHEAEVKAVTKIEPVKHEQPKHEPSKQEPAAS